MCYTVLLHYQFDFYCKRLVQFKLVDELRGEEDT